MKIPAQTRPMPSQVSRVMSFLSTHHSPKTVKRKASELVIGTVRESSAWPTSRKNQILPVKFNTSGIA